MYYRSFPSTNVRNIRFICSLRSPSTHQPLHHSRPSAACRKGPVPSGVRGAQTLLRGRAFPGAPAGAVGWSRPGPPSGSGATPEGGKERGWRFWGALCTPTFTAEGLLTTPRPEALPGVRRLGFFRSAPAALPRGSLCGRVSRATPHPRGLPGEVSCRKWPGSLPAVARFWGVLAGAPGVRTDPGPGGWARTPCSVSSSGHHSRGDRLESVSAQHSCSHVTACVCVCVCT